MTSQPDKNQQKVPETTPDTPAAPSPEDPKGTVKHRRHLIRSPWLRIPLKILFWLVVVILLIPVLLYIPPVQNMVKNIACNMVHKSTGMDIGIDRLRIRFPLDVELNGVSVVEATGDTMVSARSAVADVRFMPLLKLDVQLERVQLNDAYYRMVSPDSSMILAIRAGNLEVGANSSFDIKNSELDLTSASLTDGRMSLFMNVWKQQNTPKDTTTTPFLIKARTIDLNNFEFGMSMLPTIDTLTLASRSLHLDNGVVDLRTGNITASLLTLNGGNVCYLTPTPEYIAAHPAPVADSTAVASAPITIKADSIDISDYHVLYAMKGAKPLPGFDASYIELSDVGVGLRDFYNQTSTVRLPLTRLAAKERSGLQVVSGQGTVLVDSTGLALDNLHVLTPYSRLNATAGLPFSLMAMQPDAPLNVKADASIGLPDVDAFMPSLSAYTAKVPRREPLGLRLDADGTLDNAGINVFEADLPGVFSLSADGHASNALDFKRLIADISFNASLQNPATVESLIGKMGFEIPRLTLKGRATANAQTYGADFDLILPEGTLAGAGKVSMTSESYAADIAINHINIGRFAPGMGLGPLTAHLKARGQSFDPERQGARTDVTLDLASLRYRDNTLTNITAIASLLDGVFTIDATSHNPGARFNIAGHGTIEPDLYTFDLKADLNDVDLYKLGFSTTPFTIYGDFAAAGKASPTRWRYDATLDIDTLHLAMADEQSLSLPGGVKAHFVSTDSTVWFKADARRTQLAFEAHSGLSRLIDCFSAVATEADKQIKARDVYVDSLRMMLPPFELHANASGAGVLAGVLAPSGLALDTVSVALGADSLLWADAKVLRLDSNGTLLDTINFKARERGSLLDYGLHLGNRKGNLDEFADVNLNGYLGANRLSAYAVQRNAKGEMGYRLGFTAAVGDSTVSVHFTPLKATIAYLPWTFNADNHIDFNFDNKTLDANLQASSQASSITIKTLPAAQGGEQLHLNLTNINVEDFLQLSIFAPPLTACLNSDLNIYYNGHGFEGSGNLDITNFTYDHTVVGDLSLDVNARLEHEATMAQASLKVDTSKVLTAHALFSPDSLGVVKSDSLWLALNHFPLKTLNPFLGSEVARLSGSLNGRLDMTGTFTAPLLNGAISCDSVGVYIPMIGSSLRLDSEPLTLNDNVLAFNKFNIFGSNDNPFTVNGTVDARKLDKIYLDIQGTARNMQVINSEKRSGATLYGKLFMNLDATVKGAMQHFDINANASVLGTTDVTYVADLGTTALGQQGTGDVVKFVNFNDTLQVAVADTIQPAMAMRINAGVTISPGTQVAVNITTAGAGSGKVEIAPSGTLNYFQNFMGDMNLTGQLNLGEGMANYQVPIMGKKEFKIDPSSYVAWTGDIMNPTLNLKASDLMKVNIKDSGGNARLVNFIVGLNVTNTLSAPKVVFDLSTDDDMTLQNELASMSADQRATQAMNLLLTGQYNGPGVSNVSGNMANNMLNSLLASTLNNWAANTIKGVDLSFGVDQYDQTRNGQTSTTTSYSYQVSKSLFNNRFKINVGGNYSTDASADENFSENLINDISFEYMLRQTNNLSMYVSLFRHNDYESILEGEVTETGVGFVMRRRLSNLRSLFRFGHQRAPIGQALTPAEVRREEEEQQKEREQQQSEQPDTITPNPATSQNNDEKN